MSDWNWWQDRFDHESTIGFREFFSRWELVFELFLRILPFSFFFLAGFAAPETSLITKMAEQAPSDPQYLRWILHETALFAIPIWYFWLLRRARAQATDTPGSKGDRLVLALFLGIGLLLAVLLGIILPIATRL